jgi:lipoyl synthase
MKSPTPKPAWIKVRPPSGPVFNRISALLRARNLNTVCEEARCPNIAECWGGGTATLMLMGDVCTRGCRFCAVTSGRPSSLDPNEPMKSAETVELMKLSYVVLTSVNRDELPDGGASHFASVVRAIHNRCPDVLVETLIPDFQGDPDALYTLLLSSPHVLAHNLETVERLTPSVRDARATYQQSLEVLENSKLNFPETLTKSSIMLGLGESTEELSKSFTDLRSVGVDILTLGQYLRPTPKHLEVKEFVTPEKFEELRLCALDHGFKYVASGPLVRSSYKAGEFFVKSLLRNRQTELPVVRTL